MAPNTDKLSKYEDILRCVTCHGPLCRHEARFQCPACGGTYPIVNHVPIMLDRTSAERLVHEKSIGEKSGDISITYGDGGWQQKLKDFLGWVFYHRVDFHGTYITNGYFVMDGQKRTLDIGGGPRRRHGDDIILNIDTFEEVDIVGDAINLPFADDSFDYVYAGYLLEHVNQPAIVVKEIARVLKPGGLVFATVPFMCHFHGWPDDYQRYTDEGLKYLFKDFSLIDAGVHGGPTNALIELYLNYMIILWQYSKFTLPILFVMGAIALCLFPLIKILDRKLIPYANSRRLAYSFYYLGAKGTS